MSNLDNIQFSAPKATGNENFDRAAKEFTEELNNFGYAKALTKMTSEENSQFQEELTKMGYDDELKAKLTIMRAMAVEDASGNMLPSGRSFTYYGSDAGTVTLFLPELPDKEELGSYFFNFVGLSGEIGYPRSIKESGDLADEGWFDSRYYDLTKMKDDPRYVVRKA